MDGYLDHPHGCGPHSRTRGGKILTNSRSPHQLPWNPQLSRPVPGLWGAWTGLAPAPGYLGRRGKWARPAGGLKSLAISKAAACPCVSVHGKGSRKCLGPRPSSTGGTAPEREDAAPIHLLGLPSLPKGALIPLPCPEPVRFRAPWRPLGMPEPLRSCQRAGPLLSAVESTGP